MEPWLRGEQLDADPAIAQVLWALQQVREDLAALTVENIWHAVPGIPALGFQLKHIAGSLDRLTTYLEGRQLSQTQLDFLAAERTPDISRARVMALVESALHRTEETLRALTPISFAEPRFIGRRRIPTTAIGLAIHIAEHSQRHCGQAITTAKLVAATCDWPLQPPA
jgi:hypothetical protein